MTKNTLNNTEQSAQSGIKIYLRNGLYFVLFLMAVQLLTTLTGGGLTALGIEPRTVNGLFGIFLAPFIHSSWGHLFSNLPPLLILSVLLMIPSVKHYIKASLFIIIVGGLLVWLFGRTAVHVGASGWIFGLWALLIYQDFPPQTTGYYYRHCGADLLRRHDQRTVSGTAIRLS